MTPISLGRIEKVDDLRTIWPHEASDFTRWLAQSQNLSLLSQAIGSEIILEERESSVGSFNVDIFAIEENTGRKIIIENQLEETDHDHLGKIITYASGKDAQVIIWIVKQARDEHKQAIEWLNQHTDQDIGFFLLEIQLWKIDDSLPAPRFNVVERPNDWAKTMKTVEGLSTTKKLQMEFWQAFNEYAFTQGSFKTAFSQRKPQPQSWYNLSVGSSVYLINLTVNTQKKWVGAGIYIKNDKAVFERFKAHKDEMEATLGTELTWATATKDSRILAVHPGDIQKGAPEWNEMFKWYCKMSLLLRDIIQSVIE